MKRRSFIAAGSMLITAGCINTERGDDGSKSGDSPTKSTSPVESSSSKTASTSPTETPCSIPDMLIGNDTGQAVTVHVTITETGSRYRGMESPTKTLQDSSTPEETPVETYSTTINMDVEENRGFEEIPLNTHEHILRVAVEDGPEGEFDFNPSMIGRSQLINVTLNKEEILFSNPNATC